MPQATSISLSKFTASVQAAVRAAVAKHPKFNIQPPRAVTVSYLIRGIPVDEAILRKVTVTEAQAFANDVAAGIATAHPEALITSAPPGPAQGAIISVGGHLVLGIPPISQPVQVEN